MVIDFIGLYIAMYMYYEFLFRCWNDFIKRKNGHDSGRNCEDSHMLPSGGEGSEFE